MAKAQKLICSKTRWQGREAYTLSNGLLQMVNLTGGGHIAEMRFVDGTGLPTLNPLWVPPWKSIEPFQYSARSHARRYGPLTEGKLLSGIAGHNICLGYFGPPSEDEAAQGLSTHGEAPNLRWRKSSARLRVRAAIARGEGLAELGKYYEAIKEYQRALDIAPSSALAHFRMGEAMFYQKNFQSAANAFRAALGGDQDPKWVEVWSHIYIGRIYDLLDQRARAVNEYQLAQRTNDDTAGAQEQVTKYMQKPYSENASADAAAAPADSTPAKASSASGSGTGTSGSSAAGDDSADNKPVLKKRPPQP